MAPLSTSPTGIPTSSEFDGDDFSNNFISDLGPLLTLFGEQVTMQFLSMALGWADNILIAMGPLGIVTIIVSAIRVRGFRWLKAIIGRAREDFATVEKELLSSTSQHVCELWSGNEIVRVNGQPNGMKELLILTDTAETTQILGLSDTPSEARILDPRDRPRPGEPYILELREAGALGYLSPDPFESDDLDQHVTSNAPNLALNLAKFTSSNAELWFWAISGLALQIAALIVPGMSVYWWKWKKEGNDIATYGYPCFLAGSLSIFGGILGCSYVIEGQTKEVEFSSPCHSIRRTVWLQRACEVSDQYFSAYAILNWPENHTIRTSRLDFREKGCWSWLAASSALLTIAGFIIQFLGLRALHWSATIIQLGTTVIMTAVRARVRQGLAVKPLCLPIQTFSEAACLTLIASPDIKHPDSNMTTGHTIDIIRGWELYTGWPMKILPLKITTIEENICHDFGCPGGGFQEQSRQTTITSLFRDEQVIPFNIHINEPETGTPHEDTPAIKFHIPLRSKMGESPEILQWTELLRSAVEGMMEYIDSTEDIHWDDDSTDQLTWKIKTVHTKIDDRTTSSRESATPNDVKFNDLTARLTLRRMSSEAFKTVWNVDFDQLYSILDLWIYTLYYKEREMNNTTHAQKANTENVGTETTRGYGITIGPVQYSNETSRARDVVYLTGSSNDEYLRILGHLLVNDASRCTGQKTILDWLDVPIHALGRPSSNPGITPLTGCHAWPVFGMYMQGRSLQPARPKGEQQDIRTVAIKTNHILIQACAVELLSFFMSSIASKISRIDGQVREESRRPEGRFPSQSEDAKYGQEIKPSEVILTSETVDKLARCIVDAKLMEDLQEAKTIVIPALYQYDRLPKGPDPTPVDSQSGQPEAGSGTLDKEPSNGSRSSMPDHNEQTNKSTSQVSTTR